MRWSTTDLNTLPDALKHALASGRYSSAAVGACQTKDGGGFSTYSIAVMLFTQPQN
jgi:hypothetical protein